MVSLSKAEALEPGSKPVTIRKQEVPLAAAYVWVYRNEPGTVTPSDRAPIRLWTPDGIAIFPENVPNPARLPILGLRALVRSDLTLIMDGKRREVTLKTPSWF